MEKREKLGSICFDNLTINYEEINCQEFEIKHKQLSAVSADGEEMSYINFRILGDYVWLLKVETHKKFQHHGLASKLMYVLEHIASQSGAKYIEGKYHPFNEYAPLFYKKHDFPIPNESASEDEFDDTWRLSKELDPVLVEQNYNTLIADAIKVDLEIGSQRNK